MSLLPGIITLARTCAIPFPIISRPLRAWTAVTRSLERPLPHQPPRAPLLETISARPSLPPSVFPLPLPHPPSTRHTRLTSLLSVSIRPRPPYRVRARRFHRSAALVATDYAAIYRDMLGGTTV